MYLALKLILPRAPLELLVKLTFGSSRQPPTWIASCWFFLSITWEYPLEQTQGDVLCGILFFFLLEWELLDENQNSSTLLTLPNASNFEYIKSDPKKPDTCILTKYLKTKQYFIYLVQQEYIYFLERDISYRIWWRFLYTISINTCIFLLIV